MMHKGAGRAPIHPEDFPALLSQDHALTVPSASTPAAVAHCWLCSACSSISGNGAKIRCTRASSRSKCYASRGNAASSTPPS